MKNGILIVFVLLSACQLSNETAPKQTMIEGTWQLISSEYHYTDSIVSNMASDQEMIKIISPSHFAFFLHDLKQGKDSTNIAYMSGAGSYTFMEGSYTENLKYCTAREWENHSFAFRNCLNFVFESTF